MKWLYSMDTSNPVVHGLLGCSYNGYEGLTTKDSIKLYTMINQERPDNIIMATIKKNIELAHTMWNWNFNK